MSSTSMLSSAASTGGGAARASRLECFDDTVDRLSDVASIDLNDLAVDFDREVELPVTRARGNASASVCRDRSKGRGETG